MSVNYKNNNNSELSTIQNYLKDQEKKLYNLEHHINRMTRQFGKREKLLLTEIAKLHNELRDQTVKFEEKLLYNDFRTESSTTTTMSSSYNELPPVEEEVSSEEADDTTSNSFGLEEGEIFYVRLKRGDNNSLGFNVVGGNSAEPDCDQGVYVSRILADCPESTKTLQPYDRILKVNGRDVSQSSHHEAVEAFKVAKDPIVVQVYRRLNSSSSATKIRHDNNCNRQSGMSLITTSTQTDPISDDEDDIMNGENTALLRCQSKNDDLEWSSHSNKLLMPGNFASQGASTTTTVPADSMMAQLELAADGFIDDTDLDEECRQQLYDVEYEEVTIRRSSDGEKLGLTLCYGSGDNVDTDIFVGEIEPESVADKDGRIKAGDQILQINGVDVHTRNRAIELFGRENADITLLLARSSNGESLRDIVHSVPRLEETIDEERSSSFMQDPVFEEDDGVLTDGTRGSGGSAHEKDSGISRTTDSEPDLPPPINSSPSKYSQSSTASSARSGASCTGKEVSTPENATGGSILNVASVRSPCVSSERSFAANDNENCHQNQLTKRSDSESSLERELHNLHREMEFIQLECDRLIEQHARAERQVRQQMDQANKLAVTMDNFQKQQSLSSQQNKSKPICCYGISEDNSNKSSVSPPPLKNGRRFLDCTTETNEVQVQSPCFRYRNGTKGGLPTTVDSNGTVVLGRLTREETSSAYNTGNESCRSTPLNISDAHLKLSYQKVCQNLQRSDQNEYETIADEEEGKRDSAVFTLPLRNGGSSKNNSSSSKMSSRQNANDKNELSPKSKDFMNGFGSTSKLDSIKLLSNHNTNGVRLNAADISSMLRQCTSSNLADVSKMSSSQFVLGDIMYTNPENLQQTILLQQRLLRQAMIQQAHQLKAQQAFGKGPVPFYENFQNGDAKLEWKVKRRSDGTRYITRRPVRNKMLKERAQQLCNERVGVSTDDDAMSELKIGRYWTKDERKKHLESQKERKKRQEELIRRQNQTLQQSNDQPILQLSHKKMMRRQGQQLLDKFTTVQEFLSHGARAADGKRAFGILSVTTV